MEVLFVKPTSYKNTMTRRNNVSNKHCKKQCKKDIIIHDTKVLRISSNNTILSWYRKPMVSGRYLNYFLSHPKSQKCNTIIAMKTRVTHTSNSSPYSKI